MPITDSNYWMTNSEFLLKMRSMFNKTYYQNYDLNKTIALRISYRKNFTL